VTAISQGMIPTDSKLKIHIIHPNSNVHIYKDLVEIVVSQDHTFIISQIFVAPKIRKENTIVDESYLL